MRKFLIVLILSWGLGISNNAVSQIPKDVLSPYKKYTAAIQNGDLQTADKAAYAAWKAAEKKLGNSKTTGDLALNYALLGPKHAATKDFKLRRKAYLRAIELGKYHKKPAQIILDRHLEYILYLNSTSIFENYEITNASEHVDFTAIDSALDQHNLRGSWHEATLEGIRTAYYRDKKDYEAAIGSGRKALSLYEGLQEDYETKPLNQLILDLGDSLFKSGAYIDAMVTLQKNFHNVDNHNVSDKISKPSEMLWKLSWLEFYKAKNLDAAYAKGVCKCTDLVASLARPIPISRIPPIMPAKSVRSGEATVIFDINDDGSTNNVRIATYTEKIFGEAALKAGKKFVYTPAVENLDSVGRQNIPARMVFTLKNGKDEILPAKPVKTITPLTSNLDMISKENTLVITGARIRR